MSIEEIKEKVLPILRKHQIARAGIFGSVVRGEDRPDSDVDLLVEITQKHFSLLDFVGLQLELEEVLGRKVDLGEYCAIKPIIKDRILRDEVRIL